MDKTSLVPRLEQLAFTVSFKEILSNLFLCQDHWQNVEQLEHTSQFASFLSPEIRHSITSENLINFVRKHLDYHLVGLISDKTRKEYVNKFNETFWRLKGNTIKPWVFLECVLDESFKELEIYAASPGAEPNSRLISTIAECSSELKKLKIDFRLMKNPIQVEKISPLITSLSSLEHLTSLNLHQMREAHRSVLKLIGNACPLLTHLSISGFCVTANDIFSLILGEFADQLFPDKSFLSLEILQAPSEILTPFCYTLRHLKLSFGSEMYTEKFYSLATFVLRHLPSLEKMDGHLTSFGVEKFKNSPNESKRRKIAFTGFEFRDLKELNPAEQFDKSCKELAALRSGTGLVNRPTFTGFLSLVSLDCVYLNPDMLQTIPKFCRQLKEVTFFMASSQRTAYPGDGGSDKLQEHLKAWPKLETITLEGISPKFTKVILETFASSLKRLTFSSCIKINLMDLDPCRQLESLSILKCSTLGVSSTEPTSLSPGSFLPHLKSFKSDICLGLWSEWLERKSELTNVVLNCYHYGAKVSNHPDYYNILKMWPKLEALELRQCDGLTVSMLSNFIPLLVKLKELHLPESVAQSDPKLAAQIWEDLTYRPSPVHLYFSNDGGSQRCSLESEPPFVVKSEAEFLESSNYEESDSSDEEVNIYASSPEESDSEDSDLPEEVVMYEASEDSDSSEDGDL